MDRPRLSPLPWLLLVVALGCGGGEPTRARLLVAASVPPLAWLAGALAPPEAFDVQTLVPVGASPSAYEPGMREVRALAHAALWVRVGHPHFPFERARLDPFARSRPALRVVSVFEGDEGATDDPHVWNDPRRMAACVDRLAAALAALAPAAAPAIEARRRAEHDRIDALDAELRATLGPFAGRTFLVFHPAFSHLARAYGLRQLAIEAGHRETSAPRLGQLIRRARAARIRAVFVQPQFDRAPAAVVAGAIGAELAVLDPLAPDWPAGMRRTARALAASFAP